MQFHMSIRVLAGLLLVAVAPALAARTIFKCVDAQGHLTLQDAPCKPGSKQTREELEVPVESPPPTPFESLQVAPTAHVAAPTPPTGPPMPTSPPAQQSPSLTVDPAPSSVPPIWFCTRPDDGTRYVSHDGEPPSHWVPAGILGASGKSLAENYGPGGGAGVSAPELAKPKTTRAPPDGIAREYVEVTDDCVAASPAQACDYLQDELDGVQRKLRRAFRAERAALEPRETELRHQLEGC